MPVLLVAIFRVLIGFMVDMIGPKNSACFAVKVMDGIVWLKP